MIFITFNVTSFSLCSPTNFVTNHVVKINKYKYYVGEQQSAEICDCKNNCLLR